jgi:hypothetical protein
MQRERIRKSALALALFLALALAPRALFALSAGPDYHTSLESFASALEMLEPGEMAAYKEVNSLPGRPGEFEVDVYASGKSAKQAPKGASVVFVVEPAPGQLSSGEDALRSAVAGACRALFPEGADLGSRCAVVLLKNGGEPVLWGSSGSPWADASSFSESSLAPLDFGPGETVGLQAGLFAAEKLLDGLGSQRGAPMVVLACSGETLKCLVDGSGEARLMEDYAAWGAGEYSQEGHSIGLAKAGAEEAAKELALAQAKRAMEKIPGLEIACVGLGTEKGSANGEFLDSLASSGSFLPAGQKPAESALAEALGFGEGAQGFEIRDEIGGGFALNGEIRASRSYDMQEWAPQEGGGARQEGREIVYSRGKAESGAVYRLSYRLALDPADPPAGAYFTSADSSAVALESLKNVGSRAFNENTKSALTYGPDGEARRLPLPATGVIAVDAPMDAGRSASAPGAFAQSPPFSPDEGEKGGLAALTVKMVALGFANGDTEETPFPLSAAFQYPDGTSGKVDFSLSSLEGSIAFKVPLGTKYAIGGGQRDGYKASFKNCAGVASRGEEALVAYRLLENAPWTGDASLVLLDLCISIASGLGAAALYTDRFRSAWEKSSKRIRPM